MKKDKNGMQNLEKAVPIDPVAVSMKQKALSESVDNGLKKTEIVAEDAGQPAQPSILGQILKSLQNHNSTEIERMSFEVDPQKNMAGAMGFYRLKSGLTPDSIIKRIIGPQGDDLVCQIIQARSNHAATMGRPRTDRFSYGFDFVDIDKNATRSEEESKKIQEKIDNAKKILWNSGIGSLADETDKTNLAQFFKLITRDGVGFGRLAFERIWRTNPKSGKKELYAWRAADAGTIYKILPQKETDQTLRNQALQMIQQLKNKKIDIEKFKKDEYEYVQVVGDKPIQAFTSSEMVVHNLYPTTNIEYNGYPLTPIDQALNAITTHISITMHNKLYFQNGRAAKGMLIFKSDSVDEGAVQRIRLQFHQSINSVQNSWRMPVFGIGEDDELSWQGMDTTGKDAEFQYLMDNNARVILSAFQMSPEELPGYAHLARGTNTQALSESDNEWKLTAARDVGLRPLMYELQDVVNIHILPFIDEELAKTHQIVLTGLDKYSPEKESTRLQQDMPVHMTYNEVLEKVEKNLLPVELGAEFPLNPQFQQVFKNYLTVGEIKENFFKIEGAAKDPRYQYVESPFWFQYQQLLLQKSQIALQQQMMAQQQMQQQAMAQQQMAMGIDPNQPQEGEEEGPEGETPMEKTERQMKNQTKRAMVDMRMLSKTIDNNHNTITKQLLSRHQEIVDQHMNHFKENSKKALKEISKGIKKKKAE